MARLLTNSARWTLAGSLISKYRCRLPSATLQSILSDRVKGELKDALALERLENIGEDPKTVKKRRANGEMESEVRVLLTQMLGEENVVSVIDPMLEAMARDE